MKIVFDTNVLLSAFLFKGFSAKVYDYASVKFTLYSSEWILEEVKVKLITKFEIPEQKANEVLRTVKLKTFIKNPTNEMPEICRDKDDNNILQIADFVMADFIITGDTDLLILKKYKNTIIITPRKFYDLIIAQ